MHLIKKHKIVLLIAIFIFVYFLTRMPFLGKDVINPDAVNWHYRSEQFIVGLKSFQLEKTYQHYHPGVTLMWIIGPTVEVIRQINPEFRVYNKDNFILMHTAAKTSLLFAQLFLTLLSIYLLNIVLKKVYKNKSFYLAFLSIALFTFEPFFLGNSRLLHMDVLLTLFLFCGLISFYIGIAQKNKWFTFISAILISLGVLTKSIGIGAFVYINFYIIFLSILNKNLKQYLQNILIFNLTFFASLFLFFPALLVAPVHTIYSIFDEAERIGIRKGHDQIFFGQSTNDPGLFFYLFVFLLKLSPATLIGAAYYLFFNVVLVIKKIKSIKNSLSSFMLFISIFYIGYLIVMTISSKKLDRYMIVLWPLLSTYAVLGYYAFYVKVSKKIFTLVMSAIIVFFIIYPLITKYPYYFTYSEPLFIDAKISNLIIGQKPFGVGIYELRQVLFEHYGPYPNVGFIDTKPMKEIYISKNIFDIRIDGTKKYDLIVLGPNEDFSENVYSSGSKYKLAHIVEINGLDYWRIYEKIENSNN